MIVDVDDDIIQDNMSKIFFIKKQLRLIKKEERKEIEFLITKTSEALNVELQKARIQLCEELEEKIERLIWLFHYTSVWSLNLYMNQYL